MVQRIVVMVSLASMAACGRFGFDADQASPDAAVAADAALEREIVVSERDGAVLGLLADTTIKDYEPANNFVDAAFLGAWAPMVGLDTTPGLVRLDLSTLSGTVTSASLEIAINQDVDAIFDGETIEAFELLERWVPGEATYGLRMVGVPWSAPGAGGASRGALIGRVTTTAGSDRAILSLDVDTVQQWVDASGPTNGFILVVDADDGSGSWLASSEYRDPDRRPLLRLRISE